MIESWIVPTAAWLLTFAAHSTVLLLVALGIVAMLGRRSAAVRERVLKLGILGGLVTSGLHVAYDLEPFGGSLCLVRGYVAIEDTGAYGSARASDGTATRGLELDSGGPIHAEPVSIEPVSIEPGLAASSDSMGPVELVDCPCQADDGPWAAASLGNERPTDAAIAAMRSVEAGPVSLGPESGAAEQAGLRARPLPFIARLPWINAVLIAWGLGALFGLGLLIRSWHRLRVAIADRRPLHDPTIDGWLRSWLPGRAIRVTTCAGIQSPLSLGVLRPEICLPDRVLFELGPEERQALLAHELAHLERRDPAWLLVCRALENLLFFQPLLRVARRRLFESAESLCDLRAAQRTGGQLALASCLTEVADWVSGARSVPLTVAMAATRSEVGRRIEDLLEGNGAVSTPRRWVPWGYGLALVVVPVLVPGASGSTAPSCVRGLQGEETTTEAGGENGSGAVWAAPGSEESSGYGVTNADSKGIFVGETSSVLGELPSPVDSAPELGPLFLLTESDLACTRAADAFDGLLNDLDTEFAQLQGELHQLRELGAAGPHPANWAATLARAERSLHTIGVRRDRIRTVLTALRQGNHPAPSAPSREATQVPKEDL